MSQLQSLSVVTSIHFANISHGTTVPALQLKYLEKLNHHNREKNLPVPTENTCHGCNVLLIPGFNLTVRIVYKKKAGVPRKRVLRYKCLTCGHNNDFAEELIDRRTEEIVKPKLKFEAQWVPKHEKSEVKKSDERKKKRKKMNDLSKLLDNKKKIENKFSLDLMDFMN